MTLIESRDEFKIMFNGSKTYMVIDNNGDCWGTFSSKKGAITFLNRVA